MKKIILLLLLCFLHIQPSLAASQTKKYNNITKNITLTVGNSTRIRPRSDIGISTSGSGLGAAGVAVSAGYSISDKTAFNIVANEYKTSFSGVGSEKGYYYEYNITALSPGTYTFEGSVSYISSVSTGGMFSSTYLTSYSTAFATYTIIVKELTSITIPSTLSLDLGKSYTFSPVIAESGAETTLTWNSSNTNVATVDASGKLTTIGIGTTTIICTATNGVSAQCVVTVNPILTTGITLNTTNAELMPDETLQLKATISPSNATNKSVEWSSSNENIAIVDDAGLVKALSPGECEIKVTAVDGSKKSASCKINVLQDVLFIENSKGVPSGTLSLPIYLQNKSTITGLQFELALPEGVSVATDNTDNIMVTVSDRITDHSIMGAKLSNGNYQFILFSGSSSALSDNEGAIAYVTLNVDENTAIGEYDIAIKEIELTKTNSELIHHKDITTKLTLVNATTGDTNGDTKVTVTDAVSIVNYILEKTPSVFIQKAADVNNDSEITITDAVGIINQILNK